MCVKLHMELGPIRGRTQAVLLWGPLVILTFLFCVAFLTPRGTVSSPQFYS